MVNVPLVTRLETDVQIMRQQRYCERNCSRAVLTEVGCRFVRNCYSQIEILSEVRGGHFD